MKKTNDKVNLKALQINMLIAYSLVTFLSIYIITSRIINFSNEMVSDKVSSLIAANCRQIELNTNDYFNTVETITTLLFADEKYYKYDPIANSYDEYTSIKNEDAIAERISDLGLMQNFCDFAIVYSDGKRVGWTSNTTAALYEPEKLYFELERALTNSKTQDGWAFGVGGLTDRLFYVKRINNNALVMTSFYSRELETAFEYPKELDGMIINLVKPDGTILYSSNEESISGQLDSEIAEILNGGSLHNYIAYVNPCENGWSIVCSIPTSYIMKDVNVIRKRSILLSVLIAFIMIVCGRVFISFVFKPVGSVVEELKEEAETDKLSGLYNKQSFNVQVNKRLSGSEEEAVRTFVMIDVDNFKQINDNLGHAYGDEFIVRMGKIVGAQFGEGFVVGRVGGDEFAIFSDQCPKSVETATEAIVAHVNELFSAFDKEFFDEKARVNVSLSIGIAVLAGERRFENLYKSADEALYISKKSGKNRYTIYERKE